MEKNMNTAKLLSRPVWLVSDKMALVHYSTNVYGMPGKSREVKQDTEFDCILSVTLVKKLKKKKHSQSSKRKFEKSNIRHCITYLFINHF